MSVTGEEDGAPVKCGVPISRLHRGALRRLRDRRARGGASRAGGAGGTIDVPMFATTLAMAALQTSEYFGTGSNPRKLGSAHPRNAPYQAFRATDGWFAIAAGNDRLWQPVCEVVGRPALADDPRFATTTLRARNQAALKEMLEARFAAAPAAQWLERFRAAGVPCAPINGYAEALADPQAAHLGLVHPRDAAERRTPRAPSAARCGSTARRWP